MRLLTLLTFSLDRAQRWLNTLVEWSADDWRRLEPGHGLAPCPFCGSEDLMVHAEPGFPHVACRACDTHGPDGLSEAKAFERWNTRA